MSEDDFRLVIHKLIGRPFTIEERLMLDNAIMQLIESNQYA